ncbi:hypothetical protein CAPTEDRAFT_213057 [Capitella teleta]|uniref:Endonuclease/exonuclease/phosphatase domain-containing protein n=1 Tax=Capitella teleta TaxID=283909 RepID=R7VJQ5_CAPTE|nr:hypothetical protein CAPTEDRAFT_213057 [Capitella teleta]|eukprot:ELU16125.1 hypothetical protein CAPTEDRAFT_213057 [Capitella teleta]
MIRQSQVIKQHQIFMEKIDAKDREKNLIVTGVPEGAYLDAETDEEKLAKIVEKLDRIEPSDAIIRVKRLGAQAPDKNRPILLHCGISGFRTEWRRLFEVKEAEEKKPENAEKRIRIDLRKRQVICDGQFHSFAPLAEMKNKMSTSPKRIFIIIGDMNARFGESRTGFLQGKFLPRATHYRACCDKISSPNLNAKYIMSALQPSMVMLNNLSSASRGFSEKLTFHQGQRWISELDTCFISPEYISAIISFGVHQTPLLPSDHAPINLNINTEKCRSQPEDLTETLLRAENLHSIQTATSAKEEIMQKRKPIRMHEIDQDMICEELRGADTPALEPFNPDQIAEDLNEILYTSAMSEIGYILTVSVETWDFNFHKVTQ